MAAAPRWEHEPIRAWDLDAYRAAEPFVVEKSWSARHSIDVFEVVGTAHPDYQGLTWRQFLEAGKRMPLNLALHRDNPGYYLDGSVKLPPMYYIALDDSGWFVNGDGNHRTCIARFFFHGLGRTMLHGVHAESYRTDPYAREVFEALSEFIAAHGLRLRAEPHRKTLSRTDGAGWMRERYLVSIRLRDLRRGVQEILSPDQAEQRLAGLRRKAKGLRGALYRLFG